jgi:hypothetical protein
MAILPSVPEISITVKVGGQTAQEYEDKDATIESHLKDKTVLKYIESKSDCNFEIHLDVPKKIQTELRFMVHADGACLAYVRFVKNDMDKDWQYSVVGQYIWETPEW